MWDSSLITNEANKESRVLLLERKTSNVWLIIPALNEAENLAWILPPLVKTYNAIVVDNGSTDETSHMARHLGAHVVNCPERGYGNAVQAGLLFLRSTIQETLKDQVIVVVFDADGTSPIKYIEPIVAPVQSGKKDFVLGQRTTRERFSMPPHARFGNWLATSLIAMVTGQRYTDMGPLRAIGLSQLLSLKMQDPTWGWNVEMQIKAAMLGLRTQEIDIEYQSRIHGQSKISGSVIGSIRAGVRILWSVFWYFFAAKKLVKAK